MEAFSCGEGCLTLLSTDSLPSNEKGLRVYELHLRHLRNGLSDLI
jgi:hypothetical protein